MLRMPPLYCIETILILILETLNERLTSSGTLLKTLASPNRVLHFHLRVRTRGRSMHAPCDFLPWWQKRLEVKFRYFFFCTNISCYLEAYTAKLYRSVGSLSRRLSDNRQRIRTKISEERHFGSTLVVVSIKRRPMPNQSNSNNTISKLSLVAFQCSVRIMSGVNPARPGLTSECLSATRN